MMLSDSELEHQLAEAAAVVPVPSGGPGAILAVARRAAAAGAARESAPEPAPELPDAGGSAGGSAELNPPKPGGPPVRAPQTTWRRRRASVAAAAVVAVALGLALELGPFSATPARLPAAGVAHGAAAPLGMGAALKALRSAPPARPAAPADGSARPPAAGLGAASAATSAPDLVATGTLRLGFARPALAGDLARLGSVAASLGGFVAGTDVTEAGSAPGGTVTLRVPAPRFGRLIGGAERIGTVRALVTSTDDVTGQVVDLGAQITAFDEARSRLEALLSRAGKISQLLSVEAQIEATESQIQQLQAEQRSLANEVSYSSLTVNLQVLEPTARHAKKPLSGLAAAWHRAGSTFAAGLRAGVSSLGAVALGLLGLVVLAAGAALLVRVGRRLALRLFT